MLGMLLGRTGVQPLPKAAAEGHAVRAFRRAGVQAELALLLEFRTGVRACLAKPAAGLT